ncbi:MAG: succinate dehydrogenase [Planctomycetes bacterium]|nr:succinate dehydrogenase [Planctomycetota bacterium]
MNQPSATTATLPQGSGFGATMRKDNWWIGPIGIAALLLSFLIYSTWAAFQGAYYWVPGTNYLSPFYSPEIWGHSPHAFILGQPGFWQSWMPPFSAALLILGLPAGFRLTCYYYRKAYYRSIWLDPVACAVGEPRKSYWGENALPLILWNVHRYFLYAAIVFVFLLGYDGIIAHMFPVNADGTSFTNVQYLATGAENPAFDKTKPVEAHHHVFGMSLVSLVLILNPLLLAGYTFGCHSLRHIVGGRKDCFAGGSGCGTDLHFKAWSFVSFLNRNHATWAMLSLVVVGLADVLVRLVAMGKISDFRFF